MRRASNAQVRLYGDSRRRDVMIIHGTTDGRRGGPSSTESGDGAQRPREMSRVSPRGTRDSGAV